MYVVADEEVPRVIGWTAADVRERQVAVHLGQSPICGSPLVDDLVPAPPVHIFHIVTAQFPWGCERVIKLEGDQDPAILPGWQQIPARSPFDSGFYRSDPIVDSVRGDPYYAPMVRWWDQANRELNMAQMQMLPTAGRWHEYLVNVRHDIARKMEYGRMATPQRQYVNNVYNEFQVAQNDYFRQQQTVQNMVMGLANVRELQSIAGQYHTMPIQWEQVNWHFDWGLRSRRVEPETAARSRERARGLLKSLLTPAQWAEFENQGRLTEIINGTDFRLAPGAMIEVRRPKLKAERWCVYPNPYEDGNDYMPDEDKLIGQLLHLRAGPDKLRAHANVFTGV